MSETLTLPAGMTITGAIRPGYDRVLTPEALAFVAELTRTFKPRRDALLSARAERSAAIQSGKASFGFLPETKSVREGDWKIKGTPADLQDRRVEITGPIDRKMIINALNSGAKVFMADCEDATSPTWDNEVSGQINLDGRRAPHDLVHGDGTARSTRSTRRPRCCSCGRAAGTSKRSTCSSTARRPRRPLRFRPLLLPQREGAPRARHGSVLLPPEAREPPRGALVERRLRLRAAEARHRERHDQGDDPHRDPARRVRDGRDPLRAARSHRGPELRPLGLHLQLHQEARARPHEGPSGSLAGHDGQGLPRPTATSSSRRRHRRGAHAMGGMAAQIPIKGDDPRTPAAFARCAPTRSARSPTATTAPGSRIRASSPIAMEVFDAHMPGDNQVSRSATT
jgi:hypothetical protein